MDTNIRDGTRRRPPPPPSIYFSLTENTLEICVCLELNQQFEFSADTSNVCIVENR